jgi:hypothetical protein
MAIETLQDLNAQACCCDLTLCPVPALDCQSITGSVSPLGFKDPADTVWKIYTETGSRWEVSQSGTYESQSIELAAMEYSGDSYTQNFEGGVGQGLGCKQWTNNLTETCDTSGSYVRTSESTTVTRTRAKMLVDTETREHIAWETEHAAWETAHATWETAHATWETEHATWVTDYAAWEIDHADWNDEYAQFLIDYADWVDGGEVGPEPTLRPEPVAPDEPIEPVEPVEPEEPTEFYGACEWEDTEVVTYTDPETPTETYYWRNTSIGTMYNGIYGVPYTNTTTTTYTNGKTYASWVSETRAAVLAEFDFENVYCVDDSECTSSYQVFTEPTEEPFEESPIGMTLRSARVRFQIPHTWADQVTGLTVPFTGTYFKITYDIVEEPTGWDDEPPTATRSFVSQDNIQEWTGPGSGAPSDPSWFTDWITLDPPTVPGIRRITNVRLICREDWFVGVVPQTTGDAVELPDFEPEP